MFILGKIKRFDYLVLPGGNTRGEPQVLRTLVIRARRTCLDAYDELYDKISKHKQYLYEVWLGSLVLFTGALVVLALVFIIIWLVVTFFAPAFEILYLLSGFIFAYAFVIGIAALILWKECREDKFEVRSFTCHLDHAADEKIPKFFNIKEFVEVTRAALRPPETPDVPLATLGHVREAWDNFWQQVWRAISRQVWHAIFQQVSDQGLTRPRVVDPELAFSWKIYTYLEVAGYLTVGFVILAVGYACWILLSPSFAPGVAFIAFSLSALVFTFGFFIFVSARARFEAIWWINQTDLSTMPGLHDWIKDLVLLLPRWSGVGTCNIYMHLTSNRCRSKLPPVKNWTRLQAALDVAGVTVAGDTRDQPLGRVWNEVWNCAFSSTGEYTINLKIRSKQADSQIVPLSTIAHNVSVSSLLTQTLNPLLLAVVPVLITAVVTLITTKLH